MQSQSPDCNKKPAKIRYLLADDRTPLVLAVLLSLGLAIGLGVKWWATVSDPFQWTDTLIFCGTMIAITLLFLFFGYLFAQVLLAPIHMWLAVGSGFPWKAGTRVRILKGPCRNKIATVQHDCKPPPYLFNEGPRVQVVLETGEEDVYFSHEVMRIPSLPAGIEEPGGNPERRAT